ncbi:hypothetical protein SAMD00019534_074160 [Acytostelium subglobosum LB1]|uniref:hypothetical protein n=1 Tax=Acytostelium subglobosum LB1 TaxID=1410327 RepID=UPI000644DCB8|nr:hypothetical protein SAMD00019534_074160 [Acytostelium subglobosum LB1]GAM24241.1 hypothetical protein SAMD00019534_074160 [Acytostelium subglobosum LB1]|eukprot:XP_012752567.1 hypothetical protein SAMD00019534_074160 [Acytostelium subglobosum LB1]
MIRQLGLRLYSTSSNGAAKTTTSSTLLWGKNALVTGGSRGIGKAIAMKLAENGCNVCVLSRDTTLNQATVASLPVINEQGIPPNKHWGITYDLSAMDNYESLHNSLKEQQQHHQDFDIIVHAAGITQNDLFFRSKPEELRMLNKVNFEAPIYLTRMLLKPMLRKQWGRIIFMGSIVADMGNRGQTLYAASKAGLVGFSKSLSREIGHQNVTSNVIAPGYIQTDMSADYIQSLGDTLIQRIPLRRIGDVEDIAKTALFLIESNYITGQVIKVDGGLS